MWDREEFPISSVPVMKRSPLDAKDSGRCDRPHFNLISALSFSLSGSRQDAPNPITLLAPEIRFFNARASFKRIKSLSLKETKLLRIASPDHNWFQNSQVCLSETGCSGSSHLLAIAPSRSPVFQPKTKRHNLSWADFLVIRPKHIVLRQRSPDHLT